MTFLTAAEIESTDGIAPSDIAGFALSGARIAPTRTIGPLSDPKLASVAVAAISAVIEPNNGASSTTTTRPNFWTAALIASVSSG